MSCQTKFVLLLKDDGSISVFFLQISVKKKWNCQRYVESYPSCFCYTDLINICKYVVNIQVWNYTSFGDFSENLFCESLFCEGLFCEILFCESLFCESLFCEILFCEGLFCESLFCEGLFCESLFWGIILWGLILWELITDRPCCEFAPLCHCQLPGQIPRRKFTQYVADVKPCFTERALIGLMDKLIDWRNYE